MSAFGSTICIVTSGFSALIASISSRSNTAEEAEKMSSSGGSSDLVLLEESFEIPASLTAGSSTSDVLDVIDLTSDSPVGKKSLNVWRDRHRRTPGQAGPSTSESSRRHNTRSHSVNDSTDDIVILESADGSKGAHTQEPAAKRRRLRGNDNITEKEKTSVPPAPAVEQPAYRCPVCLDTNKELKARNEGLMCLTNCGHILCKPCSVNIVGECPVCRKKISKGKAGMHPLFL